MNLFRRPSVRYARTPEPETPYQRAGQAWDERIGSARVQAKNWRLAAFASIAISAGFASALVWQSTRGTVVPWVVEVDRHGDVRTVGPAIANYTPEDKIIEGVLRDFIIGVRSLPDDPVVVANNWLRAYEFTTSRGATALNTYARADDPFERIGRQQIVVQVSSVIRASPNSFRVAWTERHFENGQLARTERWTAILTVVIQQPRVENRLSVNPFGIYVNAINWSREMG